jgi:hypothetical protein
MKIFKILVVVFIFIFEINDSSAPIRENNKTDYKNGYSFGKTVRSLGESYSCRSFVKICNEESSAVVLQPTDYFCTGYKDAVHGKAPKF